MSIIYDALKKVDKSLDKREVFLPGIPTQIKPSHKFKPIYLYIFIVCLGLLLGNYAFNYFTRPKNIISSTVAQPRESSQIQSTENRTPATESLASPTLSSVAEIPGPALLLSGVFFEKDDGYALINNRIIRVGDNINNAIVKEINLDGVTLEFNGKIVKLANPS
ncbi:MAG: hypothetical protein NTZ63_01125 [Candidatus Omnitrophica bacterium]|nr:hypothetical protein [Candidatus Omnitrophota bacterium]